MYNVAFEIGFVALLIVANGLFAMAEMAVVSARKVRLQQRTNQGDARARAALELANAPNQFLSAVQIGITLVGILAGAFGGATLARGLAAYLSLIPLLAPQSEAISLGIVVLGIAYLSLVLGELAPKRLALNNPERIAAAAAQFIHDLPLLSDSEVTALGVLTPRNTPSQFLLLAALDGVQKIFQESSVEVRCELLHGNPAEALTEYADQHKPDLLVVGAKGLRATLGILLGGVAQQVVEYSRWPVLVVRAPYERLQRVLLVVDGSTNSQCAVAYLTRFPFPSGTEVRVMHVLPPSPKFEYFFPASRNLYSLVDIPPASSYEIEQNIARQAQVEEHEGQVLLTKTIETSRASGIEATSVLTRGDAATEIVEYIKSQNVHLVVAGSRGLSVVKSWLLGSVSRKLVHYAGCSVLIVRSNPTLET